MSIVKATPRIIGGAETTPFAYSFLVAMATATDVSQLIGSGMWQNQKCGGSLISERVVLTAAHCGAFGLEKGVKAFVGVHRHSLTQADDEDACSATIEVDSINQHPEYDDYWMTNDVALLLLKEPAPCVCSGETDTIALDTKTADSRAGTTVTVAGWGNT